MICFKTVKRFCKGDITKIENYEEALNDTSQTWQCHHRLEIMPFSNKEMSIKRLEELGLYYQQEPEALIFLTEKEHKSLHVKVRNIIRTNKGLSYKDRPSYKSYEERAGKKAYNNGVKTVYAYEQPEGFVLGSLKKNHRPGKWCWITNGKDQKMIRVNDVIPNGYFPGHLPKRSKNGN